MKEVNANAYRCMCIFVLKVANISGAFLIDFGKELFNECSMLKENVYVFIVVWCVFAGF